VTVSDPSKQPENIGDEQPSTEGNSGAATREKNGRFKRGAPPPAKAGRPKGSANRFTRSVKDVLLTTFNDLQRDREVNLKKWAKDNPGEFYRLCGKLIPGEMNLSATVAKPAEDKPVDVVELARDVAFVLTMAEERLKGTAPPPPMLTAQEFRAAAAPAPVPPPAPDDSTEADRNREEEERARLDKERAEFDAETWRRSFQTHGLKVVPPFVTRRGPWRR
jgi:hypothetical protein